MDDDEWDLGFGSDPEFILRKQKVELAKKMAAQAQSGVGSLQNAFAAQTALMDKAGVQGRRAIAQQAGQGLAAGASQGLRANAGAATNAAQQMGASLAGFEAQQSQLMADQGVAQAQQLGPAQMEATKQAMLAVDAQQELKATEQAQQGATDAKFAEHMANEPDQTLLETDAAYGLRVAESAAVIGVIPNTKAAKFHYANRANKSKNFF